MLGLEPEPVFGVQPLGSRIKETNHLGTVTVEAVVLKPFVFCFITNYVRLRVVPGP